MKRVVYLGSRVIGLRCLEYLLDNKKKFDIDIVAIGTQLREGFSDGYSIAALAQSHGIALIDTPDEIPECHIIYSVEYHKIIKQNHIDRANDIAVNLHLGPLPDYRGCNQFSFAIFNQAKVFGVTVHQIGAGIDSGDILFEDRFDIPANIWVEELYAMGAERGQALFERTLERIIRAEYVRMPQDSFKDREKKIYYRKDINTLKCIDLSEDEDTITRRIRSTYMPGFEPPYVLIDGKKMSFKEPEK